MVYESHSRPFIHVTGGNTGIGKNTCKHLLAHGTKVYLSARSQSKAEQAIHDLQQETGKTAIVLQMDLADFDSVKKAAEDFKRCVCYRSSC